MTNLNEVIRYLKSQSNQNKAFVLQKFFKTGKGEYGEGDKFWGIVVPKIRKAANQFKDLDLSQVEKLLHHPIHEVRLCALLILVKQFERKPERIFSLYLHNTKWINNWDLVDLSAPNIIGEYLLKRDRKILNRLSKSRNLWERRMAILSTFRFIKNREYKDTFEIAEKLINDKHDLIHKAVGWMLREVGKKCSEEKLLEFLDKNVKQLPRTALRYAIERLPQETRQYYLNI